MNTLDNNITGRASNQSSTLNNKNRNPLNDIHKQFSNSNRITPMSSQKRNTKMSSNMNPKNNNYIQSMKTPVVPQKLNMNPLTNIKEREREREEFNRTQKYINYLKEHLNSSYYANNEISNKNTILNEKSITLKEEIKNNNILYEKIQKSLEEKTKLNNEYKNKYEAFLNQHKNKKNDNDNINLNIEEKIKELKQRNLIANKECQSKEEIILNLKRTLDILEKSKSGKKKEYLDKVKELNEEKDIIVKLKKNIEKIIKELLTKNIKLEENKKSMIYLLNKNNTNNTSSAGKEKLDLDDKSKLLLNGEIKTMYSIIDNQKKILKKMKEEQNKIKDKLKEVKANNINMGSNTDNIDYKQLLLEEKMKNKELVMNLIISNKEAKELTVVHNQIKDKYEEEINKVKDNIESLLKNKKLETEETSQNKKGKNLKYKEALAQLLEEQKNLKMFNKEFKDKLVLKKTIEEKIDLFQKENEKLKRILNNPKANNVNNIQLKSKPNNINNIKGDFKDEENDENNIVQENQIKMNFDGGITNNDSSIYTITDKGKLFTYNIIKKKFTTVNTDNIDGWKKFISIYLSNYDGSLLLNTFDGLYILTGDNFTDLYYYSRENNNISKIVTFNCGHKYGGLILTPDKSQIIAIGGCQTKEVELLNLDNNEIGELPNLLTERINSSYSFIEDNLLYAFLGENNNSIECLDLNVESKEWKNVEYTNNGVENVFGHISIPVNDNDVLIIGGKNNHKMIMFNVKENYLEITDNKIPFLDTAGEYLFDKDKNYNQMINLEGKKDENGNEINQLICMDSKGNVHLFDNDFNYIVLLVDIHEI